MLSQWRAYGEEGGFALVFDTKQLWRCLKREINDYFYNGFYFADVIYDEGQEVLNAEDFDELRQAVERFIEQMQGAQESQKVGFIFTPFFNCSTRFKHRGFKEENEVRLTVSPTTAEAHNSFKSEDPTYDPDEKQLKRVRKRIKRGAQVPYIILNELGGKRRLPIRQIIIGPQENQDRAYQKVLKIVGNRRIMITKSETPYLPR